MTNEAAGGSGSTSHARPGGATANDALPGSDLRIPESRSALELRGVDAGVDGRPIVRAVDLSIAEGEVHALMGPNGSGKSSLAHALAGRPGYEVTAGRALVRGIDVTDLPPHERARAGLFVGHQYPIEVPGVPNREFLEEVAMAAGRTGPDLGALTEKLEIASDIFERALNEDLSGGEKKRNELLQLAVIEPVVAVLDEIDSGLDIDALRSVATAIEEMTERGLAVLLITHYSRILQYLAADHVHVLIGGEIVESGGPELATALDEGGYERFSRQSSG